MVAPSALLTIADGSGASQNQGQGYIQDLTPGDVATFTLQDTSGITPNMRWSLIFESQDASTIDGLSFSWSPPAATPAFAVQLPHGGFRARYITTIFDRQNVLSQFTGIIEGQAVTSSMAALVASASGYGPLPGSGGDATAAIKGLMGDTTLRVMYIPEGSQSVSEPILIPGGATVRGAGRLNNAAWGPATNIRPGLGTRYGGAFLGPLFAVIPMAAPHTPPTFAQRGNFYFLSFVADAPLIKLNEHEGGSINGFSAFTCDFAKVNVTSAPAGAGLIASTGAKSTSSSLTQGFRITLQGSPANVTVTLTTSVSGQVQFTNAGALTLSADTALAVDYDGAHTRLYLGGSVQATTGSQTGTIVQPWWENFWLGSAGSNPGQYPADWTAGTGAFSAASIRLSSTARYAGSGYTPPTTNYAPDGTSVAIVNFDPTYRFAPGSWWIVGWNHHTIWGASEAFYPLHNVINPQFDGGQGVTIEDIGVDSFTGKGILIEGIPHCNLRRLFVTGTQCIDLRNNSYDNSIADVDLNFLANGSASVTSQSTGIAITTASSVSDLTNVVYESCNGHWGGVFTSASGIDSIRKLFINTINGHGGIYARGGDKSWDQVSLDDEAGSIDVADALLDGVDGLIWNGACFNFTGGSGVPCILIDKGVDYDIWADLLQGFSGPQIIGIARTVNTDGSSAPVRIQRQYNGGGLAGGLGIWGDGTLDMIIPAQELQGQNTITFPSDANYTPPWNAVAWGYLIVDTSACTATRNLVLPRNRGKKTRLKVQGGHSIVPLGPTGTGPTLASGATYDVIDNGTNYVQQ